MSCGAMHEFGAVNGEETPKLAPISDPAVKFVLLADLGFITVPEEYDHATYLAKFKEKHHGGRPKKTFFYYDDDITDDHFPNPNRILKPGDKLYVRAYQQIVDGTTTSEERMAFLKQQEETVFTGAQGASLVFEEKRTQLPKGYWYASFDEKERLWKYADGDHRVPSVFVLSDGGFGFNLGYFEGVWGANDAFFSFRDSE